MKTGIIAAALLLSVAVSCSEPVITVSDRSFSISGRTEDGVDGLHRTLFVTLDKGDSEDAYTVRYHIDGNRDMELTDDTGMTLTQGGQVSFRDFPTLKYTMPYLRAGSHTLEMVFEHDGFSQTLTLAFDVEDERFSFHAEISAQPTDGSAALMVSLLEGVRDRDYVASVEVDGNGVLDSPVTIDFTATPICTIALPLLLPGEHAVRVSLSDGKNEASNEFRYDEPLRYPDMHIDLTYDEGQGKTVLCVRDNPYGLKMTLSDSLSVKGKCEWTECSSPGQTKKLTESKEVKDIVSLGSFIPLAGSRYNLTSRDATELRLTSQGHMGYGWEEVWTDNGDGGYEYRKVSYGLVPFKVTSSIEYIDLDIEHLQGLTVHVQCTQSGCVLNGKALDTEEYSYKL